MFFNSFSGISYKFINIGSLASKTASFLVNILDNSSIRLDKFSYKIYTKDEISSKEVNVIDLLNSYYKEANALLDELYKISSSDISFI